VVRYLRFVTLLSCFLVVVGLTTVAARPARASVPEPLQSGTTGILCWGYTGCANEGMGNAGYAKVNNQMYWRMFAGHNCTNYAAYRMVHAGLPNVRPWTGSGNATNWGVAMSRITDGTPAVGAVAWWRAYHPPAGSAGHVAYVEKVVNSDTIIVSQDSWGGDFSWKQITRNSGQWPSGFVHFRDIALRNTAKPKVTGTPKVGETLTAAPGSWSMSGVSIRYSWRADKVPIPGATSRTFVVQPDQVGKQIRVRVYASKSGQQTVSRASSETAPVARGIVTSSAAPTIVGSAAVGQTLSSTSGSWSPSDATLLYVWRADGEPIAGENSPTLTVGPDLLGKVIGLRVWATKDGYKRAAKRAVPTAAVAPGTMSLSEPPTVSGGTRPGDTLTLVHGVAHPRDAQVSVQWLRDGVAIPGATRSTYTLTATDLGHHVAAQVSARHEGYRNLVSRSRSTAVRALPRISTVVSTSKRTLHLTVHVSAQDFAKVSGIVGVAVRGVLLKKIQVRNGVGTATLHLAPGRPRLHIHYRRSSAVDKGTVWRRVSIP
jgi:surface antigen